MVYLIVTQVLLQSIVHDIDNNDKSNDSMTMMNIAMLRIK